MTDTALIAMATTAISDMGLTLRGFRVSVVNGLMFEVSAHGMKTQFSFSIFEVLAMDEAVAKERVDEMVVAATMVLRKASDVHLSLHPDAPPPNCRCVIEVIKPAPQSSNREPDHV